MMKMSGGVTGCCVALLLALTSVSAVHKKLDSIDDLKNIDFGSSVPKHSLVLLHWFASIVEIDRSNGIWLDFDLNSGDYGSHHYGNFEGMLYPLPWGYRYYTIGNLYEDRSSQLPSYVHNTHVGDNRDRIIIRVQETRQGDLHRVEEVYITQHYAHNYQGTLYDPDHTYQITTNLLRQIRDFSVREQQSLLCLRICYGINIDDFQCNDIRQKWGNLACLGLLLFIVIEEKYAFNQQSYRLQSYRRQTNSTWQTNSRQNDCGDCCRALAFCCVLLFFVILIFAFISFDAYHRK